MTERRVYSRLTSEGLDRLQSLVGERSWQVFARDARISGAAVGECYAVDGLQIWKWKSDGLALWSHVEPDEIGRDYNSISVTIADQKPGPRRGMTLMGVEPIEAVLVYEEEAEEWGGWSDVAIRMRSADEDVLLHAEPPFWRLYCGARVNESLMEQLGLELRWSASGLT